jgi:hypothetical protein
MLDRREDAASLTLCIVPCNAIADLNFAEGAGPLLAITLGLVVAFLGVPP